MKVLIDTDVILDFFYDRKPFSNEATQLIYLCEKGVVQGFVTTVMLSNIYYLLRKTAKHDKVIESLKILLNFMHVAVTNKLAVENALNSSFKDFEDALQNYSAAQIEDLNIVITRNVKDYKTSSLAVLTPEMFLKSL